MFERLRLPAHALTTALLSVCLAACGSEVEEAPVDAKPSALAGASLAAALPSGTARPPVTPPSAAPGGEEAGGSLPLVEAMGKIPVAAEDRTGYRRTSFKHWVDEDGDGCDTREAVLLGEAIEAPEQGTGCKITGGVWLSFYDEAKVTEAGKLDIDHVVPLAEAWDSK